MNDHVLIPIVAALVGIAAGADAAIWGMYKDAAHEGFSWPRFARSIVIGAAAALIIQQVVALDVPRPGAVLVLFGLTYAAERALVETWKTFVRVEDQSKYAIPMQFAIAGVPVQRRSLRLAAGALYVAVLASAGSLAWHLLGDNGVLLQAGTTGFLVGLVIAIGGAWKDAPIEGFERLKFFRSPALTTVFALLMFPLAQSVLLAAIAAVGYERATSENDKTFFFPSRPRGKFAGKPVSHPHMLQRRHRFVPAYVAIRLALAWFAVGAYNAVNRCTSGERGCEPTSAHVLLGERP